MCFFPTDQVSSSSLWHEIRPVTLQASNKAGEEKQINPPDLPQLLDDSEFLAIIF